MLIAEETNKAYMSLPSCFSPPILVDRLFSSELKYQFKFQLSIAKTVRRFCLLPCFPFQLNNVLGLICLYFINFLYTLIPENLCAIILSTIYLSPKNLGIKFELIWATENLGTNSSENKRYSTEPSVVYLP